MLTYLTCFITTAVRSISLLACLVKSGTACSEMGGHLKESCLLFEIEKPVYSVPFGMLMLWHAKF